MLKSDRIAVGQITSVHGIKGEVKIFPLTDDITRFSALKEVCADIKGNSIPMKIENVRYAKGMVFLKFNGISDRDNAEKLRGAMITIDPKDKVKLPEDSFFIFDLLDSEVIDIKDGHSYGRVTEILETGSNDVYVATDSVGKETLIPAIKNVIKEVDTSIKKITVDMPEII